MTDLRVLFDRLSTMIDRDHRDGFTPALRAAVEDAGMVETGLSDADYLFRRFTLDEGQAKLMLEA